MTTFLGVRRPQDSCKSLVAFRGCSLAVNGIMRSKMVSETVPCCRAGSRPDVCEFKEGYMVLEAGSQSAGVH